MNRLLGMCCIAAFAAPFASAQMDNFLDVFMVKVKPDKRSDFNMVGRRVAEANRKANGDTWISMEVAYGEGNTVYFISTRKDYAAVDAAGTAFMNATQEAYGPGGMKKMESDLNNTLVSSRSEIRRRRWDLSINAPQDADAYSKLVAEARWLRTIRVVVQPGHQSDFEESAKQVKAAFEKGDPSLVLFVSQTVAGEPGVVYYISTLQPSLAAFDSLPDLRKVMGEEDFVRWQKQASGTVLSSETMFMRILPELSNAPEAVVKGAPQFWRPKPLTAAKPKPAEAVKTGQ